MRRVIAIAVLAAAASVLGLAPAAAQQRVVNVYNWSDYIDPPVLEAVHQGDRHQGALRHLRFQRDAGDQAARRQVRLRRGGADRLFPRAPDQGRRVPEARQEQAAQSRQCLAGDRQAARRLRSRQSVRRQLHVGHHRHRLQRQGHARAAGRRMPDRQLGHRVQAGAARQVQGLRRAHARFRRRHHAGGAALSRARSRTRPSRPTSKARRAADRRSGRPCANSIPRNISTRWRPAKSAWWSAGRATSSRRRSARRKPRTASRSAMRSRRKARRCGSTISPSRRTPSNVAEAHAFIDYLLRPEVAAKNSNFVAYANGNLASQKFIDKAVLDDPGIYPDAATMKQPLHRQRARPEDAAADEPAVDAGQDRALAQSASGLPAASAGAATATARDIRAPSLRPRGDDLHGAGDVDLAVGVARRRDLLGQLADGSGGRAAGRRACRGSGSRNGGRAAPAADWPWSCGRRTSPRRRARNTGRPACRHGRRVASASASLHRRVEAGRDQRAHAARRASRCSQRSIAAMFGRR